MSSIHRHLHRLATKPGEKCRLALAAVLAGSLAVFLAAGLPAAAQQHDHHHPPLAAAGEPGEAGEAAADPHAHHRRMAAAPADAADAAEPATLSIPDVEVVTARGERVSFYSDLVAGRTVAINFVFTTCTTICPPMGANFAQLQKALGERAGRDVELISVSVDPVTDTPERLQEWGERFGAGPGWTLVTGDRDRVTLLLKALGVFTPDIRDHAPVVLLGDDAAGTWTRAYGLAPPAKLIEILDRQRAAGSAAGSPGADKG